MQKFRTLTEPNQSFSIALPANGSQMPNWTGNTLTVQAYCEEGKKALAHFVQTAMVPREGEEPRFSFEGHVPMPEALKIGSAPAQKIKTEEGLMNALKDLQNPELNEHQKESLAKNIQQYQNLKQIGYSDWYSWSVAKWGTKWDACDPDVVENTEEEFLVHFNTAWNAPFMWLNTILKNEEYLPLYIELVFENEGEGEWFYPNGDKVEDDYDGDYDGFQFLSTHYVIEKRQNEDFVTEKTIPAGTEV